MVLGCLEPFKVPQRQVLIYIWQRDCDKLRSSHRWLIYRLLPQELPCMMHALLLLLLQLLLLAVATSGIEARISAVGAPLEVHAVSEEAVQLPQLIDPLVLGVMVERLVLLCRSFHNSLTVNSFKRSAICRCRLYSLLV